MGRLKAALQSRYSEREDPIEIHSPRNCESVNLYFRGEKTAKTIGSLASVTPSEWEGVSGVLITKGYQYQLMGPSDLHEFTDLSTAALIQKQRIRKGTNGTYSLALWHLENMYGELERLSENSVKVMKMILGLFFLRRYFIFS